MKRLLPFTLAALWCRLNLTVTALLQCFRALARCADMSFLKTPPVLYGR